MDEFLLKGVTVRKLDDELRVGASWDDCTLIARPHAKACSLQLKLGKRTYSSLVTQPLFLIIIFGREKGSGVTPLPYSFCQIPRFWGLFIGVDRLERVVNKV